MITFCTLVTIVFILYILLSPKIFETFNTTSYNSFEIPDNPIETIYDKETRVLTSLFDSLSFTNKTKLDNEDDFTNLNPNISFPLENTFNKAVTEFLKSNIESFRKDKIYILGKLANIKYKDVSGDRFFVFNVTLVNPTKFFTRSVKTILKLSGIEKFVLQSDTSKYLDYIEALVQDSIFVQSIVIDTDKTTQSTVEGFDSLHPNMYRIKNRLHLTDPFLTSSSEMMINESMKQKFETTLREKSTKQHKNAS